MTTNELTGRPPAARTDITERVLLQSIVEMARTVFGAAAASVFLVDHDAEELVFAAVAGEGEDSLVGTRFPLGTGIAGWVAMSGQPLCIDDVAGSAQFARDAAASTGYVPTGIMAAPLLHDGECRGVLEVLDRGSRPRGDLDDVDLLVLVATELAMAVELLMRLHWAQAPLAGNAVSPASRSLLQRLGERLPLAPEPVATAVTQLLATADALLEGVGQVSAHAYA